MSPSNLVIWLPEPLLKEAEDLAARHDMSLSDLVVGAVAEKVALLRNQDDLAFPGITYRIGGSGRSEPVLRGYGHRVKTFVIATQTWNESPAALAEDYDIPLARVEEALSFYQAHKAEIDEVIRSDEALEPSHG